MQLEVLADGDVRNTASETARQIGNRPYLSGPQNSVGDANPHHEIGKSLAFAVRAADHSSAVSLRINSPPAHVGSEPLWRNGRKTHTREAANFFQCFPWILLPFQPFYALCFGSFGRH